MEKHRPHKLNGFKLRVKLPYVVTILGGVGLIATVFLIASSFFSARGDAEFRMSGLPPTLSKDVVAVIDNYERLETEGGRRKHMIRADRAVTYSDNHQELQGVYLELFEESGEGSNILTASKAIYYPEGESFRIFFAGNVNIRSRDDLIVKTEQVTYEGATEIATAEEAVAFERLNIKGSSVGAIVAVRERRVQLLNEARIEIAEKGNGTPSGLESATINAGSAVYDQMNEAIELAGGVDILVRSNGTPGKKRNTEIRSQRSLLQLAAAGEAARDLNTAELFGNVSIISVEGSEPPTKIASGYAKYDRVSEVFHLREEVHLITADGDKPTHLWAQNAIYRQLAGNVDLTGAVRVMQLGNLVQGDRITAELYPSRSVKKTVVTGNASLKQTGDERSILATGNSMTAQFSQAQQVTSASAAGQSTVVLQPNQPASYTRAVMNARRAISLAFRSEGRLEALNTDGRTSLRLDEPDNNPDSSDKQVTADRLSTKFSADGRFISSAEAVGNAELQIRPKRAGPENYNTTVNAPRFDCEFYSAGNNARLCRAGTGTRTKRIPTLPREGRGEQNITAGSITAAFNESTRGLERLEASGEAKFAELDRNALASSFSFTMNDQTIRLRGGEPTAWDSRARTRANEIDWNTREQRSVHRGNVSSTYYSQKQTGGATPFSDAGKPVYLTAATAELDHQAQVAIYSGNARAWQDNNYVRAESLRIDQRNGTLNAEGSVQSLLYGVRRREAGREVTQPVHASSERMSYNRRSGLLRYEENVEIRQGTDRLSGRAANVYVTDRGDLVRTEIADNVIITQPGRRATGSYARYSAEDEVVVLTGSPARVEDSSRGSSQGGQLTVYLRENRVVGDGSTQDNPGGRVRSIYRINPN